MRLNQIEQLAYTDNNIQYCGANQNFYDDYRQVYGGCAPIAAANIVMLLNQQHRFASELLSFEITKHNILRFSEFVYRYIHPVHCYRCQKHDDLIVFNLFNKRLVLPPSLGIATTLQFNLGIMRLAKRLAIPIKREALKKSEYSAWRAFIKRQLAAQRPIAMLHTLKPVSMQFRHCHQPHTKTVKLDKHWVVIVGFNDDDDTLEVMTWGGLATINLMTLWQQNRAVWGLNTHFISYFV